MTEESYPDAGFPDERLVWREPELGSDPPRLIEQNTRLMSAKVGTKSASVYVHIGCFPLEKGQNIWYSERCPSRADRGTVIADPEERYLFIGLGFGAEMLD